MQTYTKVAWVYGEFQMDGPRSVKFEFQRYWTDALTGDVKKTCAVEAIHFDSADKIVAITYCEAPLDPVDAEYPESIRPAY